VAFDGAGLPRQAVRWVDRGVLRELPYEKYYAISQLGRDRGLPNPMAYRMSGGPIGIDQMIATTWRGILVTRLNDVNIIDGTTLQCTGTTRDGAWVIENGRITHPIRNLRFNDSPIFMLNNIEQIGPATRVYSDRPAIVPALKVRDFNFNGLADAV
jgi:predicted Zn-dependent protease